MARTTLSLCIVLFTIASLLTGVYIGRHTVSQEAVLSAQDHIIPTPTRSPTPTETPRQETTQKSSHHIITGEKGQTQSITDTDCQIQFDIPETYTRQSTEKDVLIFSHPTDKTAYVAIVCAEKIPTPPVGETMKEDTKLDGVPAVLYHDKNPDGTQRDEIIATHPYTESDVIVAGYGKGYTQAISTFQFLK